MAKDITLKTRNGETRYPKSVTDLIFENGTGKTLQTIITELRTADTNTDDRTRMFKADVTNLDTLNKKTDIGLYNYVGTGWRGSVSVCYDSADNVSQVALSSSTPSYNGNTLTWLSAQPCAMARTYTNGAWSHWEKVGAPVVNDLTTGGTDKALSAEMGKTLKEGLAALGPKISQITKTLKTESGKDRFVVADGDGYMIAKFDQNGLSVTAAKIKNSNGVLTDLLTWLNGKVDAEAGKGLSTEDFTTADKSKLLSLVSKDDVFAILDRYGYAAFKITSAGRARFNGYSLCGFEMFSLGDSFSTSGIWQNVVAEITGCTFDNAKNELAGHVLSAGGTTSYSGFDSMFFRAKNLIDQNVIEGDGENAIVILENVNDLVQDGITWSSEDRTFVPTTPIEGYTLSTLADVPSASRSLNAILSIEYTAAHGKKLTIDILPSSEGDVSITIVTNNSRTYTYNFHVTASMSAANIANLIIETYFTNVTDILASDGVSVIFGSQLPLIVRFADTGSTGMSVTISDTTDAKSSYPVWYKGSSIADVDWTNTSNWVSSISFSSAYKSIIELLQRTYPKLHIFLGYFPIHAVSAADYLLPNGTYDSAAYAETERMVWMRNYRSVFKSIAEYYSIPMIDVTAECGFTISNMLTYYNAAANVHPKADGLKVFGEIVANNLINNIKV